MPKRLRARSAVAFAAMALVLSVGLSTVTYQLVRWYLLDKREALALRQVTLDALVVRGQLAASELSEPDVLTTLQSSTNTRAVLQIDGEWYSAVVQFDESTVPASLRTTVAASGTGRQRARVNGEPYIVYGFAIPGRDASYFEFVSAAEYERTLGLLARVLFGAASVATVAGAIAGWLISRRLLRPLTTVAESAQTISHGDLSHRLDVGADPDLRLVAESFNSMAQSLEERISREHRFTADVSHELRTPLTAMGSAVSLAQRSDLPERAAYAIQLLDQQLHHFRRLTLELLEISRMDAGVSALDVNEVRVLDVIGSVLDQAGVDRSIVHSDLDPSATFRLDGTRFERIIANLVENADRYGGGVTDITVHRLDNGFGVAVDDSGPGVPEADRAAIFGRFNRGSHAQPPDKPKGTGLGLALVHEHVRLHGGEVEVTDSPTGGARFSLRIPEVRT